MGIRPSMQKKMSRLLRIGGAAVCELGDQFCGTKAGRMLASQWYQERHCSRYVSLDANGLNGAIAIDLNSEPEFGPVGKLAGMWQAFDIVTDFGTGEHVWNQDRVWRLLHDLCKPNGHIVFDRPTQGYGGHCFYLIDRSVIAGFCHFNGYEPIWIGRAATSRGELLRGILKKAERHFKFQTPQQGRYFKHIGPVMSKADRARGADWRAAKLVQFGLTGKQLPPLADETSDKGIWDDDDGALADADSDSAAGAGGGDGILAVGPDPRQERPT